MKHIMQRPRLQKPELIINRVWAMPNKWTFTIKPIKELLQKYNVGKGWADPFCGQSDLCEYRNDLNPENTIAQTHLEAKEFADQLPINLNGVVFDPPYSLTQVSRSYQGMGKEYHNEYDRTGGFISTRTSLANKIKSGGHVIYFGWNSNAFGKKRGFEIIEILLVAHGSNRNDTIVTIERKT